MNDREHASHAAESRSRSMPDEVEVAVVGAGPVGLTMATTVRHAWARVLWSAYPPLVAFVVVATANHWWFDAFTGALTAAVAAVAAMGFARIRPAAWAWMPPPRTAAAQQPA